MARKQVVVFGLVFLCMALAAASAQSNEVAGLFGRTLIDNQTIVGSSFSDNQLRFGSGSTLELNYARHLVTTELVSISVEVPFVLNPDEDWHTHTTPAENYRAFFLTPSARVNLFGSTAVSPWVSAGGGFGHFSGQYSVTGISGTTNFGNTVGVFQAGFGLDVRIVRHFKLRGELRDFWSGKPALGIGTDNQHQRNLFVAAGVMWNF